MLGADGVMSFSGDPYGMCCAEIHARPRPDEVICGCHCRCHLEDAQYQALADGDWDLVVRLGRELLMYDARPAA